MGKKFTFEEVPECLLDTKKVRIVGKIVYDLKGTILGEILSMEWNTSDDNIKVDLLCELTGRVYKDLHYKCIEWL